MPAFYNQATLSFNGNVTTSNITQGELVGALSATKTALSGLYSAGERTTYVISVVNSNNSPLTGLTVTDDLGRYTIAGGTATVYPLDYVSGSAALYINGVKQPAVTVTEGPPLVFTGINVPAGGNAVIAFEADINRFTPLEVNSVINNTAEITGGGITPVTAEATITAATAADLSISKCVSPTVVTENGQLTYTFHIQNIGNTAATTADTIIITDTFDPVLKSLSVAFNGTPWTAGTEYTYDDTTGVFSTATGQITVPAASYEQNPNTGEWYVNPGISTLIITGTV